MGHSSQPPSEELPELTRANEACRIGAAMNTQRPQRRLHVRPHGMRRDVQEPRDLAGTETVGVEVENRPLARAQTHDLVVDETSKAVWFR